LGKKFKKLGRILPTGGRFSFPHTPQPVFTENAWKNNRH
jgi:hypothetical protein